MIFAANEYDLENDEGRKRPGHFTRKDLKVAVLGLAVFLVFAWPIYRVLKNQRDAALCNQNLQHIGKALLLYAEANDNSYPPAYQSGIDHWDPHMDRGRVITWVSLIELGPRASFDCPSSDAEDRCPNANPNETNDGRPIVESSYGMYGALSGLPLTAVERPGNVAMLADSSNRGGNETYNPSPFSNGAPDGFMIGLDNSNFKPNELQSFDPRFYANSQFASRLAFPGTKDGNFGPDTRSRHDHGVHLLMADGHRRKKPLRPEEVRVAHEGAQSLTKGLWQVPYRN